MLTYYYIIYINNKWLFCPEPVLAHLRLFIQGEGSTKKCCCVSHSQELHVDEEALHVMVSYQWDVQETIRLIVTELQVRGYLIW